MKESSKAYQRYKEYFEQLYPGQSARKASDFVTISDLIREFASLRKMQVVKVKQEVEDLHNQADESIQSLQNVKFEPVQDKRYKSNNRVLLNTEANKKFDFYIDEMPDQNYTKSKKDEYDQNKKQFDVVEQVEAVVNSYVDQSKEYSDDKLTAVQKDVLAAIDSFKEDAFQSLSEFKSMILDKKNALAYNTVLGKQTADQVRQVAANFTDSDNKVRPSKEALLLRSDNEQEQNVIKYRQTDIPNEDEVSKSKHQKEDRGESDFKNFLKFNKENQSKQLVSLQSLVKGQTEEQKPRTRLFDPVKGFLSKAKSVANKASGLEEYLPLLLLAIPLVIGAFVKIKKYLDGFTNKTGESLGNPSDVNYDTSDPEYNQIEVGNQHFYTGIDYGDTAGKRAENILKEAKEKGPMPFGRNSWKFYDVLKPGKKVSTVLDKDQFKYYSDLGMKLWPNYFIKGNSKDRESAAKAAVALVLNLDRGAGNVGRLNKHGQFADDGGTVFVPESIIATNQAQANSIAMKSVYIAERPELSRPGFGSLKAGEVAKAVDKFVGLPLAESITPDAVSYHRLNGIGDAYYPSKFRITDSKVKAALKSGIPMTPENWLRVTRLTGVGHPVPEYVGNHLGEVLTRNENPKLFDNIYTILTRDPGKWARSTSEYKESPAYKYYNDESKLDSRGSFGILPKDYKKVTGGNKTSYNGANSYIKARRVANEVKVGKVTGHKEAVRQRNAQNAINKVNSNGTPNFKSFDVVPQDATKTEPVIIGYNESSQSQLGDDNLVAQNIENKGNSYNSFTTVIYNNTFEGNSNAKVIAELSMT